MSLHLRFSHRMEPLLDGLDALLDELWVSVEHAPRVVVPSPSVARWLKLRLCERRGPLVGLETTTLEAVLWKDLAPERTDRLLRVPLLQQAVLAVLPDILDREEFHAVKAFLRPQGKPEPSRDIQFAHEMARLFLEYEYNRPSVWNDGWRVAGLDRTWPHHPYFSPTRPDATESWQRILHGLVFAPDGPLTRAEPGRLLGLPRLHRLRREEGWTPPANPLVLFSLDKVSHFHRNLIQEIAQVAPVHLFLLNPCSAFWEDVNTSRRRIRGARKPVPSLRFVRDGEIDEWQAENLSERIHPSASSDPALLERWGRTSRENVALWCQATDYDFEDLENDAIPVPDTLLGAVQESLRQRHAGPRREPLAMPSGAVLHGPLADDGSIVLLEAPDRGREMESIRGQILSWLAEDPSRTISDVVVLMPDPSRHRVEIERVFGGTEPAHPGHIPWTLLGSPSSESLWARGAVALLDLAGGVFDRPGVFALLRNALCRDRLGIDESTVAMWERWCDGAGILRGWDARERSREGAATSQHTFLSGLRRLLVAPLSGADGVLLAGESIALPPWRDFDSADSSRLEPFCAAAERLHADIRRLHRTSGSPTEASNALLEVLDGWLDVSSHPAESTVRRSLRESLEGLRLREDVPLDLAGLTEIVKSLLEGELPGSSRAWTGSVTFAPLRPGNILPHGLVAIAGLDAEAFPGERATSALDLLSTRRIVGDPDVVADNRHAFLLALLSCRSRLVLSWRSCDIQKDEEKNPSPVVLELETALLEGFLETSPRRKVRLLEREAPLAGELDEPVWTLPGRSLPEFDIPAAAPVASAPGAPVRVGTARLKRFLLDSWSHRIEHDLDATEDERPDTMGSSDEPLDSSSLLRAKLRSELFPRIVRAAWDGADANAIERLVVPAHERSLWDIDSPEGALARAERGQLLVWASELAGMVARLRSRHPDHVLHTGCDLGLGQSGSPSEPEIAIADGRVVRVSARLPAVASSPHPHIPHLLLCPAKPSSGKPRFGFRYKVEPMLWGLLAELSTDRPVQVVLLPTEAGKGGEEVLQPPPPDAMRVWLPDVLRDLLEGHCEYLPASTIVDSGALDPDDLREALEGATWTPPLVDLLDPLLPGEAEGDPSPLRELAERRLGPFLANATESVVEEDDS